MSAATGIMALDPPDYWLILDTDGLRVPDTFCRAWLVGRLQAAGSQQVVLVRIDPP